MIRLDDIPKKSLFEVPEGYFEKLPGRIQARVAKPEPSYAWGTLAFKYALPVLAVAVASIFVLTNRPGLSPEEIIAGVESEQLVAYLTETDINADDLLEAAPLYEVEVESLQQDVFGDMLFDETVMDEFGPMEEFDTVR